MADSDSLDRRLVIVAEKIDELKHQRAEVLDDIECHRRAYEQRRAQIIVAETPTERGGPGRLNGSNEALRAAQLAVLLAEDDVVRQYVDEIAELESKLRWIEAALAGNETIFTALRTVARLRAAELLVRAEEH